MSIIRELLSVEEFEDFVAENRVAVVDFYTSWCPPCKMMEPELEKASKLLPKAAFARVNLEQAKELIYKFDIRMVPTLIVFVGGKPAGRAIGFHDALWIARFVREAIGENEGGIRLRD